MRRTLAFLALAVGATVLAGCGPSLKSTIQMRCGESQVHTLKADKCVVLEPSEGDCAVKVTVQCAGEAEKSTEVRPGSNPGKLCCSSALGQVRFEGVGDRGECKFTYGRD